MEYTAEERVMYKNANITTVRPGGVPRSPLAEQMKHIREQEDIEKRACTFAVRKVDEALAVIAGAYTCHEGIYDACLYSLLGLEEVEQLPLAAQSHIVKFLAALAPESGLDRDDQARAAAASLTEKEALQFTSDLLRLRHRLEYVYLSLCDSIH